MAMRTLKDVSKQLRHMSEEELLELKEELNGIIERHEKRLNPEVDLESFRSTDLGELLSDDMESLAALANDLDKRGFCEAADEIDNFIKAKKNKFEDPGRLMARALRRKFASK